MHNQGVGQRYTDNLRYTYLPKPRAVEPKQVYKKKTNLFADNARWKDLNQRANGVFADVGVLLANPVVKGFGRERVAKNVSGIEGFGQGVLSSVKEAVEKIDQKDKEAVLKAREVFKNHLQLLIKDLALYIGAENQENKNIDAIREHFNALEKEIAVLKGEGQDVKDLEATKNSYERQFQGFIDEKEQKLKKIKENQELLQESETLLLRFEKILDLCRNAISLEEANDYFASMQRAELALKSNILRLKTNGFDLLKLSNLEQSLSGKLKAFEAIQLKFKEAQAKQHQQEEINALFKGAFKKLMDVSFFIPLYEGASSKDQEAGYFSLIKKYLKDVNDNILRLETHGSDVTKLRAQLTKQLNDFGRVLIAKQKPARKEQVLAERGSSDDSGDDTRASSPSNGVRTSFDQIKFFLNGKILSDRGIDSGWLRELEKLFSRKRELYNLQDHEAVKIKGFGNSYDLIKMGQDYHIFQKIPKKVIGRGGCKVIKERKGNWIVALPIELVPYSKTDYGKRDYQCKLWTSECEEAKRVNQLRSRYLARTEIIRYRAIQGEQSQRATQEILLGSSRERVKLYQKKAKGDLWDLRTEASFTEKERLLAVLNVAKGLECLHDRDIVHRDLKPGNVLLFDDGAKIIDFGFAKEIKKIDNFAGTPLYMPPEAFEGCHKTRAKEIDIFALALILHELTWKDASGNYPILVPFLHPKHYGQRPTKENFQAKIDAKYKTRQDPLVLLIKKGLSMDPSERPSASEFARELEGIIKSFA